MWIYIILGIIIVLIIAFVAIYNNMVSVKLRAENAFAQVDTQLKRRFDLIPNLVETVKGYMNHEAETLEKVISARSAYNSAGSSNEKVKAGQQLENTLKTLFAVTESYPDLKADKNFIMLQEELTETEQKILYARQFYNDAVQLYNTTILMFPANMVAKIYKYEKMDFFEITKPEERENVKVSFEQ